jgi:DtxR family Mn-dependent transcriptional regulator
MNKNNDFYTSKGYYLKSQKEMTEAMEDYLEMICRLAKENEYVRINMLANKLNVRPSSTSKMVQNLKKAGYVQFEKYGFIKPTKRGWEVGNYLLYRHDVLHNFFCFVNNSQSELKQVELIEHFITEETVKNIEKLMEKMKKAGLRNDHSEGW